MKEEQKQMSYLVFLAQWPIGQCILGPPIFFIDVYVHTRRIFQSGPKERQLSEYISRKVSSVACFTLDMNNFFLLFLLIFKTKLRCNYMYRYNTRLLAVYNHNF